MPKGTGDKSRCPWDGPNTHARPMPDMQTTNARPLCPEGVPVRLMRRLGRRDGILMGLTGLEGAHPDGDGHACFGAPAFYPFPKSSGDGTYMAGICPDCGAVFEDGDVIGHGADGPDESPSWRAGAWAAADMSPKGLPRMEACAMARADGMDGDAFAAGWDAFAAALVARNPSRYGLECACPPIGDSSDCPIHGEI